SSCCAAQRCVSQQFLFTANEAMTSKLPKVWLLPLPVRHSMMAASGDPVVIVVSRRIWLKVVAACWSEEEYWGRTLVHAILLMRLRQSAPIPNGGRMRNAEVLRVLRERLKEHESIDARTQPRAQIKVESTSLALLALRNDRGSEYAQLLQILLSARNRDGSWPAFSGDERQGCWATALAVLALRAARHTAADWARGIQFL